MSRLTSLPKLAQEIVDSNQRVLDSLAGELSAPEANEDPASARRRAARAARQLTRFTTNRAADARDLWELAQEVLREGVSGEDARALAEVACSGIRSWLALAEKAREVWQAVQQQTGAAPEGLDLLRGAETQIRALQADAERAREFLSRTRRPADAARLTQGSEDVEQGRRRKAEDVCSRFQAPAE